MHAKEIARLAKGVEREGMTIVPLRIYFNAKGRAKIAIALGRGKKLHDKRETEKARDWNRDKSRLMRERGGRVALQLAHGGSCCDGGDGVTVEGLLASDFAALPDLIRAHAAERPDHLALIEGDETLTYGALAALMDPHRPSPCSATASAAADEAVAICARNSIPYGAAFLGILAAGAAGRRCSRRRSTPASLVMMLKDSGAGTVFLLDPARQPRF